MQYGSLTPLLVTTLLSYLVFVFVSEQLNPFFKPKSFLPGGSRWRRGWLVGLVFFLCTITGLLAGEYFPESRRMAIAASTAVFVTFCLLLWVVRFIHSRVESPKFIEERSMADEILPMVASANRSPVVYKKVAPESDRVNSKVAVSKRVEKNQQSESSYFDANSSEERALERELEAATAHIDPQTTDFDQSIAEAHFQDVLSSYDLAEEFSHPEFAVADDDRRTSAFNESGSEAFFAQAEPESSQYFKDTFGEFSNDVHDIESEIATKTLKEIEVDSNNVQSEQIHQLSIENKSLIESKEALVSKVNQLNLKVKKSEAVARKNQALKEQATELKNKALALAAMERKKRKMTEIRAGKAILKLQRSVRLLQEHEHA